MSKKKCMPDPMAVLTIRELDLMTPTLRRMVARWLRAWANSIDDPTAEFAKRFVARFYPPLR